MRRRKSVFAPTQELSLDDLLPHSEQEGGHRLIQGKLLRRGEHALTPLHQAGVAGDAKDPGAHPLRIAQLIDVLEDLEESVLRDLLGILALPAHQQQVLEDLGVEHFDEAVERSLAAGHEAARQFDFVRGLRRSHPLAL